MKRSDVRAHALGAGREAMRKGFLREPSAFWLLWRAIFATLRTAARLDPSVTPAVLERWLPDTRLGDCPVPFEKLPQDGSVTRIWPRLSADGELMDWLGDLTDPPDEVPRLWRCFDAVCDQVLRAKNGRPDELLVSRVTCAGRDRYFYYWSGGWQDGIHEFGPSTAATDSLRRKQLHRWAQWSVDEWSCTSTAVRGLPDFARGVSEHLRERGHEDIQVTARRRL